MAAQAVIEAPAVQRRGRVYVALAAVAWSSAGVLQRQLSLDIPTQLAGRALFSALALTLFVAVAERGRVLDAWRSIGIAGVGVALCLAAASASFIAALNHTTVARVLFVQAIAPVLAGLFAWILLREPVGRRTALAMAIAFAGVGLMLGAPAGGDAVGDALALVMATSFALALVITRHRRDVSMAPATCLSQILLLALFLPFADVGDVGGGDLAALAALGAGQIGLGLALLTIGARLIPAAQVALISLLEVVLGPLWVWIAVSERPGTATLVGGAVVVAAILIQTSGEVSPGRGGASPPPPP
jgi:drug/metabolite transporter (DMT)-like permease